jgi:hypothetical protein
VQHGRRYFNLNVHVNKNLFSGIKLSIKSLVRHLAAVLNDEAMAMFTR